MNRAARLIFLCLLIASVPALAAPAAAEREYGDAWAELGNWARAERHYRRALSGSPTDGALRVRLAVARQRCGAPADALARLRAAGTPAELPPEALSEAAELYLELAHPAPALECFRRLLSARPEDAAAHLGAGRALAAQWKRSRDDSARTEALDHLRSALRLTGSGPLAVAARAQLDALVYGDAARALAEARELLVTGRAQPAADKLTSLLAAQPELEEARALLGLALASPDIGQLEQARECWARAPDNAEAQFQLGLLAFEEDDLDEARARLERGASLAPADARIHYQLGLLYLELDAFPDPDTRDLARRAAAAFARAEQTAVDEALAERARSKLALLQGSALGLAENEVLDRGGELEVGRRLGEQIEKRFGLLRDPELQRRLDGILQRLLRSSDRLPSVLPYRVRLLDVDGINALGLAGGTIYLYRGLVETIRGELGDSDDAFAAILGHELVHIDLRHGLGLLELAGGGGRALESGSAFDLSALHRLMRGVSRRQEFEADQLGSLYAYRAGFDPAAAWRFHRHLAAAGHEIAAGGDHPTHGERADGLREYLLGLRRKARHFDGGLRELELGHPEAAIRHLEVYLGLFPASQAAWNNLGVAKHRLAMLRGLAPGRYRLSTSIDPRRTLRPLTLRQAGPDKAQAFAPERALMEEAVELFAAALRRDPDYRPARSNLGASLLALGRAQEGAATLEAALAGEATPSPATRCDLAVARLLTGRQPEGRALLAQLVGERPQFAEARFNLGQALAEAGQPAEAREQFEAYLALDGDSGWAADARQRLAKLAP